MRFHLNSRARSSGVQDTSPADDSQIGPDAYEWPSEQMRRMNDDYRSWRHDRYRESSDESSRSRHQRSESHPRGDGPASMRRR